jgi:hypothetical protein
MPAIDSDAALVNDDILSFVGEVGGDDDCVTREPDDSGVDARETTQNEGNTRNPYPSIESVHRKVR